MLAVSHLSWALVLVMQVIAQSDLDRVTDVRKLIQEEKMIKMAAYQQKQERASQRYVTQINTRRETLASHNTPRTQATKDLEKEYDAMQLLHLDGEMRSVGMEPPRHLQHRLSYERSPLTSQQIDQRMAEARVQRTAQLQQRQETAQRSNQSSQIRQQQWSQQYPQQQHFQDGQVAQPQQYNQHGGGSWGQVVDSNMSALQMSAFLGLGQDRFNR